LALIGPYWPLLATLPAVSSGHYSIRKEIK
jgi:hypothetical protein